MTGSDSTTPCKVAGRQGREGGKVELESTDQLRRLAIKNSYGHKSLPTSPLASRKAAPDSSSSSTSSSTSSLNQLPAILVPTKPADTSSEILDCKVPSPPPSSSSSSSPAAAGERLQPPRTHKSSPYITRQELLHSLRRTSSNFSVGVTQTTCSGSSSYVHYTPRHLTRTNFSPRPAGGSTSRPANTTPDSSLGKYEDEGTLPGKYEEEGYDGGDIEDTQSMVELHVRPSSSSRASRRHRGRSPNPGLHYQSVEVPARSDNRQLHALGKRTGEKETHLSQVCSQHGNPLELRRTASENVPAPALRLSRVHSAAYRQTSPGRHCHLSGSTGCQGQGSNTLQVPQHTSYTVNSGQTYTITPPATMTTGLSGVDCRHAALDRKLKLHVPQGRKTASLV